MSELKSFEKVKVRRTRGRKRYDEYEFEMTNDEIMRKYRDNGGSAEIVGVLAELNDVPRGVMIKKLSELFPDDERLAKKTKKEEERDVAEVTEKTEVPNAVDATDADAKAVEPDLYSRAVKVNTIRNYVSGESQDVIRLAAIMCQRIMAEAVNDLFSDILEEQ